MLTSQTVFILDLNWTQNWNFKMTRFFVAQGIIRRSAIKLCT